MYVFMLLMDIYIQCIQCTFSVTLRNCRDYDLCEECEKRSDLIHAPDHIFLKVKVPCLWLGQDSSGFMRPLLPYVAYSHMEMRYAENLLYTVLYI